MAWSVTITKVDVGAIDSIDVEITGVQGPNTFRIVMPFRANVTQNQVKQAIQDMRPLIADTFDKAAAMQTLVGQVVN